MLELTRLLYGPAAQRGEPFKNFTNPHGHSAGLSTFHFTQINERILEQAWQLLPSHGQRAGLVVEVGSFIGRSSVLIGNWLRERGVPLLCIDTWSGSLPMTLGHTYADEVAKRNGQPTFYHKWLLNVIAANLTESVLPLVAPSLLGARVLDYLRLAVDVVYLDSAHELRETFLELSAFWPLVKPGGLLLGDDFNWRAVSHDAQLFARTHGLELSSFDGCHERLRSGAGGGLCVWYIRKPLHARFSGQVDRRPVLRRKPGVR